MRFWMVGRRLVLVVLLSLATCPSPSRGYYPLDPNVNITVKWDILDWNDGTYDIPKPEAMAETDPALRKFIQGKSQTPPQAHKVAIESSTVTESILKFEREFNLELHSLGPILSSSSQAEPYPTHLAQWILGVDN